ncbi:hypothetical protein OHA25_40215 [Nonomuraea sp. NBC_00507]|uniref:hypothetical protein n=1 Tax=Nonomuraea sp. NBC_00507 TaxID=2976002 RepID=UPI002E176992
MLFLGGLILSSVLGTGTFPSPFEPDTVTEAYFAANQTATLVAGIMYVIAALPLITFVSAIARGRFAGLARTGGFVAAAAIAASGLVNITIVAANATGDALHTLHYLAFLTGGLIHVPALGLLLGAGTAALTPSAPLWTTILGYAAAASALLSISGFVTEATMMLLPLGRFTGILWIVITATRLARGK